MKTKTLIIAVGIAFCAFPPGKVSAQWVQSSFPTTSQVTDMMFYGNVLYAATIDNGIWQSNNFSNWSAANNGITTTNIREIISVIEAPAITFYAATDAGIFRSSMLGNSWMAVNNGLTNLDVKTVFSDGSNLFAGTSGGAFRSANNGQNWTPISIGTTNQMVNCFYKNGSDLLAGISGVGDYLYRSTDNGLTWNSYGTGVYEIYQLDKLDNELFAVSATVLYHSSDNGATWSLMGPGLVPGMPIFDIATGYDYLWIASMGGGFIQQTDSSSFIRITNGMPLGGSGLSAIAVNDNRVVFGTLDDGIWYAPHEVITHATERPLQPAEIECFPNPTHGKFQIVNSSFQLSNSTFKKIEIIDKKGRCFGEMETSPGNSEFNISLLPPGIYFLRMITGNEMIIKKIIKL